MMDMSMCVEVHDLWVSLGKWPQSCLSLQGPGSKLQHTLFSSQTLSTNISPSEHTGRERMYSGADVSQFSGSGERVMGAWRGLTRVGAFANSRNPAYSRVWDPSFWSPLSLFPLTIFRSDLLLSASQFLFTTFSCTPGQWWRSGQQPRPKNLCTWNSSCMTQLFYWAPSIQDC